MPVCYQRRIAVSFIPLYSVLSTLSNLYESNLTIAISAQINFSILILWIDRAVTFSRRILFDVRPKDSLKEEENLKGFFDLFFSVEILLPRVVFEFSSNVARAT